MALVKLVLLNTFPQQYGGGLYSAMYIGGAKSALPIDRKAGVIGMHRSTKTKSLKFA